jgi:hypothetical protein
VRSRRGAVFALVVLGCALGAGVEVSRSVSQAHSSSPPPGVRVVTAASLPAAAAPAPKVRRLSRLTAARGPQILFRNAIPDKTFGKLAVASLADPDGTRAVSDLRCDRVYYADGRGLCLTATSGFSSRYVAKIFDAKFHVLHQVRIAGLPSRARVSPDGLLGSSTVFVNGDSYAPGQFSTRTIVIDMRTGREVASLEKFTVTKDGVRFTHRNFNFWGVTFAAGDDRFYATLGSGAKTYLVEGSLLARSMRVIHEHVECPSLSPDGTRIAFKRSTGGHGAWRLYVLDLHTMREHALAETTSIDDQAEWLDNGHVLYWRAGGVWKVRADGTGRPVQLLSDASSPVTLASARG